MIDEIVGCMNWKLFHMSGNLEFSTLFRFLFDII